MLEINKIEVELDELCKTCFHPKTLTREKQKQLIYTEKP